MTEQHSIIRRDPNGEPYDLVISCDLLRLECMADGKADGEWWLAAYRDGKRVSLFLRSKRRIKCSISEDELGCVDDTPDIHALIDSLMGSVPDLLGGMSEDEHMDEVRGRGSDDDDQS